MHRIVFGGISKCLAHITGHEATFLVPSSHSARTGSNSYWSILARKQSWQKHISAFFRSAILLFEFTDDTLLRLSKLTCNIVLLVCRITLLNDRHGLIYERHHRIPISLRYIYLHILLVFVSEEGFGPPAFGYIVSIMANTTAIVADALPLSYSEVCLPTEAFCNSV